MRVEPEPQPHPHAAADTRLPRVMAAATAFLGLAAFLGWILDSPSLKNGFSRGWAMSPVAALLFVLSGVALWIASSSRASRTLQRLGQFCALLVVLVTVHRMVQLWLGWSFSLDQLLFPAALARDPAGIGLRMNAGVALLVGMLGFSVFLVSRPGEAGRLVARAFGVFIAVLGGLAVLGYVTRRGTLADSTAIVPVSLNSSLGFLLLALGVWAASSRNDAVTSAVPIDALRRRVKVALGVALVILVSAASLSIWGGVRSGEAARQRKDGFIWRTELGNLLSVVRDAETGQRGYLLTGDSGTRATYRAAVDSLPAVVQRIDSLAKADSTQTRPSGTLDALIRGVTAELGETVQLKEAGRLDSALKIVRAGRGIRAMDSIKRQVGTMLGAQDRQVAAWDRRVQSDSRVSLFANVVAGLLAVTFLSLAGIAINRDLLKRSQAEAAVRESERRLAQIIELIPNMVFLKEPKELRFVHFNKAGEELLGFSRDVLIGKNDFDFFPEEEARQFVQKDRAVLAQSEVVDIPEEAIHTRDRGVRILHTKKVTVHDESGRPLFLLGISEDVTDRKQAEAAIREAKDAAELANRAKSGFLAKMSHELRTPLNSIIGFSEILEEGTIGPLTEKQRRYVGNVLVSGRNLLQLINDILDLSKVEAGRMELAYSEFDAAVVLEEVKAVVGALAEKKRQSISVTVEKGLPFLHADRAKVVQVMFNLIGNAIKFTPEGGHIEVKARLAWREQESGDVESMEISVSDNGIGIAPENLERIFGEFEQVAGGHAADQGGTGLGLALSRKLVQLHGGTLDVESTLGAGSTFQFRLPVRRSTAAPAELSPAAANGTGPLALVVDDEVQARDLLTHYLTESGFRVATVGAGRDAVQSAAAMKPDLITLDILMPDRDGFVTLAELKSSPITRTIPVVVVSVSDQRELGFSLGAADWLVKPVQRNELLAALRRTVERGSNGTEGGILVVDDDAPTLEYLQDLLRENGYYVRVALGGQAGIEQAIAERPAMIILDLVMPDVNGLDVVRTLRERPETAELPILILTAKELSASDVNDLRQSVQGIVPKGGREVLLTELARIWQHPPARR